MIRRTTGPDWVFGWPRDGDAAGMAAWLDAGGDPFVDGLAERLHSALDYVDQCTSGWTWSKAILDRRPKFTTEAGERDLREMVEWHYPGTSLAIRKLVEAYLGR